MLNTPQDFNLLLQASAIGIATVSVEGYFLTVNETLCTMFGYSESELLSITFQALTHPDDLSIDLTLAAEVSSGLRHYYHLEKRYYRKDGTILPTLLAVGGRFNDAGKFLYYISQITDLTVLRQTQESLINRTKQLENILTLIPGVVLIRNRAGVCTQILSERGTMFAPSSQMLNQPLTKCVCRPNAVKILAAIKESLDEQKTVNLTYNVKIVDRSYWFDTVINPLNNNEVLIVARDTSDQHNKQHDLWLKAATDELTGLYKRDYLIEQFNIVLAAQARLFHRGFSLVVLDVDHLKAINTNHTHLGGDLALQAIAKCLQNMTRKNDVAARLTVGDEFALLLVDIDLSSTLKRVEIIRQQISQLVILYKDDFIPVSVSIGVAAYPQDGNSFMDLYELAATRLLTAKNDGRNRISV